MCLRAELVLERGSLAAEPRPPEPEFERANHFVGLVKICAKPFEGDAERGVPRKLAGDDGDGVVDSGGASVFEADLRGAIVHGTRE